MLISLSMTNFMQHENLTVNFTEGLNAIRGANEAGKSSIYWAIQYAFYGVRALPLSLEDTVTWGQAESSLKVLLEFEHQGEQYSIKRSKSGAELKGPDFLSSGHAEVTSKMEDLFGAKQDIARSVLISNQDDIRRGLGEGNMDLIETLSDTDLIDTLIKKIQVKLPTGNTRATEDEIAKLSAVEKPELVIDSMTEESERLAVATSDAYDRMIQLEEQVNEEQQGYNDALSLLTRYESSHSKAASKSVEVEKLQKKIAAYEFPDPWSGATEQELLDAISHREKQKKLAAKKIAADKLNAQFAGIPSISGDDEVVIIRAIGVAKNKAEELAVLIKHEEGHISVVDTCPTCGTVFKDKDAIEKRKKEAKDKLAVAVPELKIVRNNIDYMEKQLQSLRMNILKIKSLLADASELAAEGLVEIVTSSIPPTLTWIGGDTTVDSRDYEGELEKLRSIARITMSLTVAKLKDENQLQALMSQETEVFDTETIAEAQHTVSMFKALKAKANDAGSVFNNTRSQRDNQYHNVAMAVQAHNMRLESWQKEQKRLEDLKKLLSDTQAHNNLIKKLRDARPVVVNKLWQLLLHLISQSFSDIRGVQSSVGRSDKGFTIDGKSYKAYSGSTIDSLGLAVREAMQKVFLGTVDFTMVDEAAKGMDAERHTNMLAQLSRSGFRQVLVITHSDLVDSYATNLIQL